VKLLLDTCTFLWIVSGDKRLSEEAARLFAAPDNDVLLSAASAWEIAVKHRLRKLPLPDDPRRFGPRERERHRIGPLPITEAHALATRALPDHHRDPFDRLLVAQSVAEGAPILTPDPLIARYPVQTLW
jgi:PIN domain nuclease of toxin-antitoxin system